jgi:hypothetical protein
MLYPGRKKAKEFASSTPKPIEVWHRQRYGARGGMLVSRGWLIFMWTLIGTVIGQLLGSTVAAQVHALSFLNQAINLGFSPTNVNLGFLIVTLGIALKLSVGGAIGLVLALWLALRNA